MEDSNSTPPSPLNTENPIHVLTEDDLEEVTIVTLNSKKVEIEEAKAATIDVFPAPSHLQFTTNRAPQKLCRLKTMLRKEFQKTSLAVPKAIDSIEEQLAGLDLDKSWRWHSSQMLKTPTEQAKTIREIKVKTRKVRSAPGR